jgi:hypothetical protein
MTAVDVCRLNKHDSPDLVYGRHDGTVFKRLINAFSFRPTVVATVPVNTVFANNPYAQNVRPTITNIPMINVRLVSFQSVSPVSIQGGNFAGGTAPANINLNDAVNQVQTFIEGNMLVNRVTNVISSRQVLFFYVDRRAHVMNVGMRHFNLNNLPKSVAGLERTNEKPVTVPATIHCGSGAVKSDPVGATNSSPAIPATWSGGTQYHLRSAVCVKTTPYADVVGTTGNNEGLGGVALVTGSTAIVMNNGTTETATELLAPVLTDTQKLYDPVAAIQVTGDNVQCWTNKDVNDMLSMNATILVYQSNDTDERLSLLAV